MRISIPNIFPLGYLLFLTFGTIIAVAYINTMGQDGIGITIFLAVFELLCLGMVVLISTGVKIILVTTSELRAIYPFKFKIVRFKIDERTSFNMETWDAPRLGVYQKVNITSEHSSINFSDFEFSNFNRLIEHLPVNTHELWTVREKVAKFNRVVNFILTPIVLLFLIMAISQLSSGITHPIPKINFVISSIILYRLTSRLFVYFRWTGQLKELRKRA